MRKLAVTVGVIALALPLLAVPSLAKPDAPLGVVVIGNRASVGQAPAASGTSVYNGDLLSTDATGSLRVRLGGGQVLLGPDTTVALHEQDGMVDVILQRGNVRFASVPGAPMEVHVLQAMVRTKEDGATGQVAVVNSHEFQVGSQKGDLSVSVNGEMHLVSAPHIYDMTINTMPLLTDRGTSASAPGSFPQTQGQGSNNSNNNNNNNNSGGAIGGGTTMVTVVEALGVAAGSGVIIYLACESPSIL